MHKKFFKLINHHAAKETPVTSNYAERLPDFCTNPVKFEPKVIVANAARGTGNHSDEGLTSDAESSLSLPEKYAELEARFQELKRTHYRIAHDLQAPLRAINGFSNFLMEEASEKLDEQCKTYLNRICTASQRMGDMFDGILKLAGIKQMDVQNEPVNLSELVVEFSHECKIRDPQRHVEFKIEKNITVMGDAGLLTSLIRNLLENAWKYTGKEASAEIEFGCKWQNEKKYYFIRDNGVGFDVNKAGQLFEPFMRLHAHDEFPGIGLGLATTRKIVELHGGTIRAEAEAGKGATIWFSLPGKKAD